MAPSVQKKRRSRKASYKPHPYPTEDPKHLPHATNIFAFNSALKTSTFTNSQNVANGGNPVFQFPIPNIDPMKATMLNDEVDMYFPRKHFLTKFQMLNDLVENIIIKPIPTDKIVPPRLFPIAFVEGMPYEKKKAELLQHVKKVQTAKEKRALEKKAAEAAKRNREAHSDPANVDDDNLSDYDPDFDSYQIPEPEETEEEIKIIDDYLTSRKNVKDRTDFLFGDVGTMKMQEKTLAEAERLEKEMLEKGPDFGDKFQYNMKVLEDLHKVYTKFTANSISECQKKVEEVEGDIKEKYNTKFVESDKIKQFKTSAFDSVKVEISLDEYNQKFKAATVKPNIPMGMSASQLPNNMSPVSQQQQQQQPHNQQQDQQQIAAPPPPPSSSPPPSAQQQQQPPSTQHIMSTIPDHPLPIVSELSSAHPVTFPTEQEIPPQLPTTTTTTTTSHTKSPEATATTTAAVATATVSASTQPILPESTANPANMEDEDLLRKQSTITTATNDMNTFLKDFGNDMLYESGDFNNGDDDDNDDFGSLSNEVFLNL